MDTIKRDLFTIITNNNLDILSNNVDWYQLLAISVEEKIEAYLYAVLSSNKITDQIPKSVKKAMYLSYQYNCEKNALYFHEFNNIHKNFIKNKIQVYPYRGLFLITNIYKNYGLRHMEDIDILISKSDELTIKRLLENEGYTLSLINDKNKENYDGQDEICTYLFVKNIPESCWIPHIKLDLFLLPEKNIEMICNAKQSIEYIFLLMCKSLFDNACEQVKEPTPANCTLMKLIDIFFFIKKYPKQSNCVLNHCSFKNSSFLLFTKQCIEYFCNKEFVLW